MLVDAFPLQDPNAGELLLVLLLLSLLLPMLFFAAVFAAVVFVDMIPVYVLTSKYE